MKLSPVDKFILPVLALGVFGTANLVYLGITEGIPPRVTGDNVLVGTLVNGKITLALPSPTGDSAASPAPLDVIRLR